MGLNPRKLYVDSQYRTSGTHSDFAWTLPQSFECDSDAVMLVDSFATANEFAAISDVGTANHLLNFSTHTNGAVQQWQVAIPTGHYTADALATALATAMSGVQGNQVSVVYDASTSRFTFTCAAAIKVWTRDMLRVGDAETNALYGTGGMWSLFNGNDINDVIGAVHGQSLFGTTQVMPEMCDLAPVKVLYLCSNLGQFTAIDPRGHADNIIRRIDVTAPYGSWFVDRCVTPSEYVEVGGTQISQLCFQLRDSHGSIVHKTKPVSFSLVFLSRSMLTV